jgi:YlmC/YmxH family sporulation protein
MRMSELQAKKIINISTGRNMGNIIDADIKENGSVEGLIIEQNRNIFSLNRESDTRIYWSDITKIGEDVILVKKD